MIYIWHMHSQRWNREGAHKLFVRLHFFFFGIAQIHLRKSNRIKLNGPSADDDEEWKNENEFVHDFDWDVEYGLMWLCTALFYSSTLFCRHRRRSICDECELRPLFRIDCVIMTLHLRGMNSNGTQQHIEINDRQKHSRNLNPNWIGTFITVQARILLFFVCFFTFRLLLLSFWF